MNTWTNFVAFGHKGFVCLLTWSWHALVLLGGVWLGLKIWRTKSSSLRHHVWLAALVAMTLLPMLNAVVEKLALPKSDNAVFKYVVNIPQPAITAELLPASSVNTPTANRAAAAPPSKLPVVFAALFWSWAVSVMGLFAGLWRQQNLIRWMRAESQPVSAAELGFNEMLSVELKLSPNIHSPVLAGVWRPMILLPADIASWTNADERRAMLRHELAHIARHDPLVNLFQTLMSAVLFFHPLVRYACRQLQIEREIACDDQVINSGVQSSLYAESILKAAQRGFPRASVHQLAFFSTRQMLERRIEMILNPNRIRVVTRQWRYLILPIALIGAASFLLVSGRAEKASVLSDSGGQSIFESVHNVANGSLEENLYSVANPETSSANEEQVLIRMIQQVIDGIPERKYGDANLGPASFYNASGDSLLRLLGEYKAHDFAIKKVIANDYHVGLYENRATISFNAAIRAQHLVSGNYPKEVPIRYQVRLVKLTGQWQVDPSQKALPPPPPPLPPPPPSEEMTVVAGKPLNPLRWQQDKNSVFALLREAADANIRRDTSFFERTLDEDYIETGPSGETFNKAQAIADIKRMDYTISKFEFDDLSVSGSGQMAFATFLGTVYFQANGQDSTVQYRYTINFIQKDGQLKIAAVHMSRKQ